MRPQARHDASTNVDPISDEDRSHLHLSPLTDLQKEKNEISLHMQHEYNTNGDSDNFNRWLRAATQNVQNEYYNTKT
eukprot:scaffold30440_cov51-Skeletonema_marinoi.AAC.1